MALRRQPVTRRRGRKHGYVKVSVVRLLGVPLWDVLPDLGDVAVERDRYRQRGQTAQWRVLLPASEILQDAVNLFFFAESLKERQQVQELCVIHVVEPGLNRDSIFWMENVRGR